MVGWGDSKEHGFLVLQEKVELERECLLFLFGRYNLFFIDLKT